jgi:hypothetical protein
MWVVYADNGEYVHVVKGGVFATREGADDFADQRNTLALDAWEEDGIRRDSYGVVPLSSWARFRREMGDQ